MKKVGVQQCIEDRINGSGVGQGGVLQLQGVESPVKRFQATFKTTAVRRTEILMRDGERRREKE